MLNDRLIARGGAAAVLSLVCLHAAAQQVHRAAPIQGGGPDLNLSIKHYNRVMTTEGVLRESRYEEKMIRRQDHVWVERVLPKQAATEHHQDQHGGDAHDAYSSAMKKAVATNDAKPVSRQHKHFNPVMLPRHVFLDGARTKLEYVNVAEREVVSVSPAEYENVNFDGSWTNAFHLVAPKAVMDMPLSGRPSPVPGAAWREQERNGLYQRVLWDNKRMIPLLVESGDRKGTFYQRVEVTTQAKTSGFMPWQQAKGFAQKEYADFLD